MSDQSHLDARYFVDRYVYNCPFCNRRNVQYWVTGRTSFNWSEAKTCYCYIVECSSCEKKSMHLTFTPIDLVSAGSRVSRFSFPEGTQDQGAFLDDVFFYSVPTSFFALNEHIPRRLRELLTEAEGCLKSNFLTGASACARKVIYELAVLSAASGDHYEDRIKALKVIHPEVDASFFDTLLTIQGLTSSKVHENSLDGWESKHLRVILKALAEVLHEIYVLPRLKEERRKAILQLSKDLMPPERSARGEGKEPPAVSDPSSPDREPG